MSNGSDGFTPELVAFVDEVETYWSGHGMRSADRRRLIAQLEEDLAEAIQNGASADELIRDDVGTFAASVATADGIGLQEPDAPKRATVNSLVATGLLGGLAAALAAWILIYNGVAYTFVGVGDVPDLFAALVLHSCAALITIAGMVAAIRWRFKHDPRISRIVLPVSLLIVLAGTISVGPIMLVAAATNYSPAPLVLLIEIGIAAAFCGAAIAAAARRRLPHA